MGLTMRAFAVGIFAAGAAGTACGFWLGKPVSAPPISDSDVEASGCSTTSMAG